MSKLYIKTIGFDLANTKVDNNGVAHIKQICPGPLLEMSSPNRILKVASCVKECSINYAGDTGAQLLTVSYGIYDTIITGNNEITVNAWIRGVDDRQFTYVLSTANFIASTFVANVYILSDE